MPAGGQQPKLSKPHGSRGNGCWCGQGKGAGASYHQYRQGDVKGIVGAGQPPANPDERGENQYAADKNTGDAVGHQRHWRFFRLNPVKYAKDTRQSRLGPRTADLHFQWVLTIHTACMDLIPGIAGFGQVLPGQSSLIERRVAADNNAVGWQGFPWPDPDHVACGQIMGRDYFAFVATDPAGHHWLETGQCIAGQPCPVTCLHFDVTAKLEEERKHAHGFKIDFLTSEDGHPGAGDIGKPNGRGHWHIHGQVPGAKVSQCVGKERTRTVEDDRGSHQKTEPAEKADKLWRQLTDQFKIQWKGQHHGLERANAGNGQADQRRPVLCFQCRLGFIGLIGAGAITQFVDGDQQVAEPRLFRIPDQASPLGAVVNGEGSHPGLLCHVIFQ